MKGDVSDRSVALFWRRRRQARLVVCCLGSISACSRNFTGPVERFIGIYALESVNGQLVPFQTNLSNGCTRLFTTGDLGLHNKGGETGPIYSWGARATDSCPGATDTPIFAARDGGLWSTDGKTLFFQSSNGDRYTGTGDPANTPVKVTVTHQGATYRFSFVSSTPLP